MSLKTERIKQPVVTGTTQPLKIGGIAEDGSDAKLTIATDGSISTSTGVTVPSLVVNSKNVASNLLAEYTVTGSAVTSIDFSGLDINTHKSYKVEVYGFSTSACILYCFVNGNANPAAYYTQSIVGSATTVSSERSNNPYFCYLYGNDIFCAVGVVTKNVVNGNARILSTCIESGDLYIRQSLRTISGPANTNITQLTFTASVANSIGVGSTIRLYRGDV